MQKPNKRNIFSHRLSYKFDSDVGPIETLGNKNGAKMGTKQATNTLA